MPRLKRMLNPFQDEHGGVYHCISRVVNRDFVLKREEKEKFVQLMRLYEKFCGVKVLTFCVMSNHFHILVEVPAQPVLEELSDEWLLEKLALVYSEETVEEYRKLLEQYAALIDPHGVNKESSEALEKAQEIYTSLREKYFARMWDLGQFMKVLKQRFTQWFNGKHRRKGTLWEQRYKSVIVEGGEAARVMAAYIDLNPVRAGMVKDPKDYRWCGYAQAVAGVKIARVGLVELMKRVSHVEAGVVLASDLKTYGWRTIAGRYRVMLFEQGREVRKHEASVDSGKVMKRGYSEAEVECEQEAAGQLSVATKLRSRIRHFSEGVVIGSGSYVEDVFENCRPWFGENRKRGRRRLRQCRDCPELLNLHALRELRG